MCFFVFFLMTTPFQPVDKLVLKSWKKNWRFSHKYICGEREKVKKKSGRGEKLSFFYFLWNLLEWSEACDCLVWYESLVHSREQECNGEQGGQAVDSQCKKARQHFLLSFTSFWFYPWRASHCFQDWRWFKESETNRLRKNGVRISRYK